MVCTFHPLGYRILRAEGYPISGFRLVHDGEQMSLFRQAMDKADVKEEPSLLLSRISLAKNDLISPSDLEQSNEPFEFAVKKEQIKLIILIIDCDPFLAGNKRKPGSKLQDKALHFPKDGCFKIFFAVGIF